MTFYRFALNLTSALSRLFFKMEYENTENIPTDEGFIVCSNHTTWWDPIFAAPKIKPEIYFMAKEEFFSGFLIGTLFKNLNAFPVKRGSADMSSLKHAEDIVKGGGVLCLFPEGTRSKDKQPGRAKPGVAMIASKVNCGILPVGISYKGRLALGKKVTVRYGKFIPYAELGITEGSSSSIRKASVLIMERIVNEMDEDCYDKKN